MKSRKNKKTNYKKRTRNKIKKAGANGEGRKIKSLKNASINSILKLYKQHNSISFKNFLRNDIGLNNNSPEMDQLKIIRTNDDINDAVTLWCSDPASAKKQYGHISDWDTSRVNDMTRLFFEKNNFNDDISRWNVSNVTDMKFMFYKAHSFNNGDEPGESNNPLEWNVSNVTNMAGMFNFARSFNQNIHEWNVSSVTNMRDLFDHASNFNQDISNWNVSSVTNMNCMFSYAKKFNQNISGWNVSNDTSMWGMFQDCDIPENYKPKKNE